MFCAGAPVGLNWCLELGSAPASGLSSCAAVVRVGRVCDWLLLPR